MFCVEWLHKLRRFEFDAVLGRCSELFRNKRVLEIGSGSGYQLGLIKEIAAEAFGVDVEDGNYRELEVADVVYFDGRNLPFGQESFDTIYSSNVLEHVTHQDELMRSFKWVLKGEGRCVHVVPTHTWRFWTLLTFYPYRFSMIATAFGRILSKFKNSGNEVFSGEGSVGVGLEVRRRRSFLKKFNFSFLRKLVLDQRHGEFGTVFTELFTFHPLYWKRKFVNQEWEILDSFPIGLFYTGYSLLGSKLTIEKRVGFSRMFGSSCYCFVLRKKQM